MLEVQATEKLLQRIYEATARVLAETAYSKFRGNASGKFNRYTLADRRNGTAHTVLVYFKEENTAVVMTYEEALEIPVLGDKCREIWKE